MIPDSVGTVTIDGGAGDVVVDGVRVEARGDNHPLELTAGGAVDVRDASVVAPGPVRLAGSNVDASRALLHADNGTSDVVVEATGGDVRLTDATLKGRSTTSPDNDLRATVPSGRTVYVDGATFVDANDALDVTPDGAANGTPAAGSAE